MFAVSYVIIFAFHLYLDIDRVIIERSFGHLREKLTSLNYLTREQLNFKDNKTLLQLRDCALPVADKKDKIAISEMFSTELKFAADSLLKWFNKKFRSNNLELINKIIKIELSNKIIKKYEVEHPINWQQDRCCLCSFPLEIRLPSYNVDEKLMSYSNAIIFKEHKFLRNIFSSDELAKISTILAKIYETNFSVSVK